MNAIATRPNGNALSLMGYEREQIDLIKKTVAPDATDTELQLFLHTCKTRGLDPLLKQVYFIKRGGKGTIQVSIDGFRMKAAETRECAGIDDAEFFGGLTDLRNFAARVTVWRLVQGTRCPFTATARWDEYVQAYNGKPSGLWEKMPHTMLAKCAESLALRKAFPAELGGLYTNEEMTQADNRTVDRVTGEIYENRRPSDPPRDAAKHERLDGELIHPPIIDPATGRSGNIMRGEENEHYAARSTDEEAANAVALKKGIGTHKGWMVNKKLDPENRALSLYLLNRVANRIGLEYEWKSRKALLDTDWAWCNTALAKLSTKDLNEWVQAFYAAVTAEEAGAEEDPFSDACIACGKIGPIGSCSCTAEDVLQARADAEGAAQSMSLGLDVPVAAGPGHGSH